MTTRDAFILWWSSELRRDKHASFGTAGHGLAAARIRIEAQLRATLEVIPAYAFVVIVNQTILDLLEDAQEAEAAERWLLGRGFCELQSVFR